MSKLRCAILDDYQGVALRMADWSALQDRVEIVPFREHIEQEPELVKALADFDIAVIMRERTPFGRGLFSALKRLKLLVTTGMRNASIDMAAAKEAGVVVCGTASSSEPPAELTWALILGLARQLVPENNALRSGGPWQSTVGDDLNGRCLAVLGLGKIGAKVAKVGQAFGMDVVAWSPNLTQERAAAAGVRLAASKEELMRQGDFVTLHLVLSERTRGLVGRAELAAMKPSAYLVNTSRSGLVDTAALVEALRGSKIAGAGLDVFDVEPLPAGDALRSLPNVLATPHLGYVTRKNYTTYFKEAADDIRAFIQGEPVRRLS